MKIKSTLDKIPGGMMIIPLLLGAVLNTLAPGTSKFFGGFTGALITGILPILAVFFFCLGATIDVKASGIVLKKSVTLVGTKVIFAALVGIIVGRILHTHAITSGFFAGLSVLAIVAALNDTNGGLFMALMNQYGTKEEASAFSLMALESGPFMTMVTLGVAGLAAFPWQSFLGAILPFLVGFLLGNLDHDLRELFGKGVPVLIPFFAFALGNGLNFQIIAHTGLLGILLGLFVILFTGAALFTMDRLTGGNGVAGIGASSTAGAAVGVPVAIAAIAPQFKPLAASATALVATSVLVTAIVVPFLTAWWSNKVYGRTKSDTAA